VTSQRFEELAPLDCGSLARAVKRFEYSFDLTFGDQRHRMVADELFCRQQRRALLQSSAACFILAQVGNMNDATLQRGAARQAFAQSQMRVLQRANGNRGSLRIAAFACAGLKAKPKRRRVRAAKRLAPRRC
jgi:hypothetical protein